MDQFGLTVSYVSCVHGVLTENAIGRIFDAGVSRVVTTDTLPPPAVNDRLHVVSTAPLLAAAIRNIHTNESVTQISNQQSFVSQLSQEALWPKEHGD